MSDMLESLSEVFDMILAEYGPNDNFSSFDEWLDFIGFNQDSWSVDQLLVALNSSFPGIGNLFPDWSINVSWEHGPVNP